MTEEFIDEQMERLSGQDYFGEIADGAIREIRLALMTGENEAIVRRVVSDFIAGTSARPTAHDLREMCHAENNRNKPFRPAWKDDKSDAVATLLADKNLDPGWAAAYMARQEELKKNPLLGRFQVGEGGQYSTVETPAKAALRVACQRMGGNPAW